MKLGIEDFVCFVNVVFMILSEDALFKHPHLFDYVIQSIILHGFVLWFLSNVLVRRSVSSRYIFHVYLFMFFFSLGLGLYQLK